MLQNRHLHLYLGAMGMLALQGDTICIALKAKATTPAADEGVGRVFGHEAIDFEHAYTIHW